MIEKLPYCYVEVFETPQLLRIMYKLLRYTLSVKHYDARIPSVKARVATLKEAKAVIEGWLEMGNMHSDATLVYRTNDDEFVAIENDADWAILRLKERHE